ncbi:hypothetical protein KY465_18305, partial [Pseudohoeflea sp. DP4N28-3]|nr:hypothetical protein [Pseudohoeflea sp. DP4N28-3]
MAKNAVTDWSTTAASNTDVGGVDIRGTALPSNMDDGMREIMEQVAKVNAGTDPVADTWTFADPADLTKRLRFDAGSITTATTRVVTMCDADVTFGAYAPTLLNVANEAAFKAAVNLEIGTDVQAYSAVLAGTTASFTTDDETKLDGISTGADVTATALAPAIYAATAKATPVDADTVGITDSAASNALKKVTWANIKATLKTYFDTLYHIAGGTDVPVADGGTGASTAAGARTNLGLAIGTDVQAYDAGLASIAGLTTVAGDILYLTGSDTYAKLAKGTADQVLTMNSGATAPEWADLAASGLQFVETWTYSTNVSTIDFTDLGSYKEILLLFEDLTMTSNTPSVLLSTDNGSTFLTSGYRVIAAESGSTAGTVSSTGILLIEN